MVLAPLMLNQEGSNGRVDLVGLLDLQIVAGARDQQDRAVEAIAPAPIYH